MRTAVIALSILLGSGAIVATLALRPTGFDRCVSIVSRDIDDPVKLAGATLDPRDVEVQAAKICAGGAGAAE